MSDKPGRPSDLFDLQQIIERGNARPRKMSPEIQRLEMERCREDMIYFTRTYVRIFDNDTQDWIPFDLWDSQMPFVQQLLDPLQTRLVALKARQVGFTWVCLAYYLWKLTFRPITEVLMFSQGEDDALALLSDRRMGGMYSHLPPWMQEVIISDNKSEKRFRNGSGAKAIPSTRGGDSNTVTDVFIDEADLIDNLDELLRRAKPTLGQRGKLVMISRSRKETPDSIFKKTYAGSETGHTEWKGFFMPWYGHPKRDPAWYEAVCLDAMETEGTLDGVHEMYPATPEEAMAPRSLDKRINGEWVSALYAPLKGLDFVKDAPVLTGLTLYRLPQPDRKYVIGADPAEGNPSSDDSVAIIMDELTFEEVAVYAGKVEPDTFAANVVQVAHYFNHAAILPERNNHGHQMISALKRDGSVTMRAGTDGKPGWLTNAPSKVKAYDDTVKVFSAILKEAKDAQEKALPIIHNNHTSAQLRSIDVNTLKAPEGFHDDYATAYTLAIQACTHGVPSLSQQRYTGLYKSMDETIQRESENVGSALGVPTDMLMAARLKGIKGAAPAQPQSSDQSPATERQKYLEALAWARYGRKPKGDDPNE